MVGCVSLESKYQYFVSEVIMLRLFSIIEFSISEFALKLASGATYKNGTAPLTLVACTSISDAHGKMISYKRKQPLRYLEWTTLKKIETTIKFTLDLSDKFYTNIATHISLIDEMRDVRNHIAHRNAGTAAKYYKQLQLIYGGNPKLTIGAFLMSTVRHPISNLERYIKSTPVILHDICNG